MILQLFGWMLVDVDHDHLPAPRLSPDGCPQAVALAVFAAGLALLGRRAFRAGELAAPSVTSDRSAGFDPVALGAFLFGGHGELAMLLGCLLAAALLAALSLLREEGGDAG